MGKRQQFSSINGKYFNEDFHNPAMIENAVPTVADPLDLLIAEEELENEEYSPTLDVIQQNNQLLA